VKALGEQQINDAGWRFGYQSAINDVLQIICGAINGGLHFAPLDTGVCAKCGKVGCYAADDGALADDAEEVERRR
jgi:hypothetical protein